jgi:hypothetical protein
MPICFSFPILNQNNSILVHGIFGIAVLSFLWVFPLCFVIIYTYKKYLLYRGAGWWFVDECARLAIEGSKPMRIFCCNKKQGPFEVNMSRVKNPPPERGRRREGLRSRLDELGVYVGVCHHAWESYIR